MDLALYDSEFGYYARTPRRSGRAGDFFTSVDVGPVFGELLALQLAEMAEILESRIPSPESRIPSPESRIPSPESRIPSPESRFDLIEAGAGDGRLSADILRAAKRRHPMFYDRVRLHLVEASAAAREAHRATLDDVADRLASSTASVPAAFEGALIANELLDAMPVHQVVMRDDGLREIYVDVARAVHPSGNEGRHRGTDGPAPQALTTREGPLSTPALAEYLQRLGVELEPGWRVEINLRALGWIHEAARRLRRGFVILIDYGHEARHLYSPAHSGGTLTTFARHTMAGAESSAGTPPWLLHPGEQDITAHVDFTSIRAAAEAEGLETIGFLDQTYFVLGLMSSQKGVRPLFERLELKTLLMPGGLGSTHKVLILGKNVGRPALSGCSYGARVT